MTPWLVNRVALTNGVVVFLAAVAIGLLPPDIRPWTPASITPVAAVLSLIAVWRSRVHAVKWLDEPGPAWRGVVEATLLGPVLVTLILTPAMIGKLFEEPGDVLGMMGFVAQLAVPMAAIGLTAGVILRAVALFQLRRPSRGSVYES